MTDTVIPGNVNTNRRNNRGYENAVTQYTKSSINMFFINKEPTDFICSHNEVCRKISQECIV